MLKVLLAHNHYGSATPSGENSVFLLELDILQRQGCEIRTYTRHSDDIRQQGALGALKGALSTPWNPWSAAAIRRQVQAWQPDVVHVHNTFPLLSPAIFPAVGPRAAKVLTLHNYRLFCSAAIPMRAGQVCTLCMDRQTVWPALQHGCYRGSRIATTPLALSVALHRTLGTWQQHVDAFIALTEFQRERMMAAGLPADKVHVKPNFYPGNPQPVLWQKRGAYAVFAGRLTEEKGLISLLQAWTYGAKNGLGLPPLRIVGDGPLRGQLQAMAKDLPIEFLGQLPANQSQEEIAHSQLLLLPSECFEGFPMVVREAFAFGTPVAVSNLGPLPTIVAKGENGLLFEPANPRSLATIVAKAWNNPGLLQRLGEGAYSTFQQNYTEETNYQQLMQIYQAAIENNQRSRARKP